MTVTNPSAAAAVASGTAALTAGTATIALPGITANSLVRFSRQTRGGSAGELYAALTPGTGFTINSTSATDTGKVYWEIVSY